MKKIQVIILLLASLPAFSQDIRNVRGNLSLFKTQTSMAIEFTYDSMTVGKEGSKSEQEYLKERRAELDDKRAGRGDEWVKAWVDDRKEHFEPAFRKRFEKFSKMTTTGGSPTYTMVVNTTRTEPGWHVNAFVKQSALIDLDIKIVETADRSKVVARLKMTDSHGPNGYSTGRRIQEAYAAAGQALGEFIAIAKK